MSNIRLLDHNANNNEKIINTLWSAMAKDLNQDIVGLRDWAYIKHRYCQHPEKDYQLLLIKHRLSQKPLGLAIIHREEQHCKLMDYIGALKHLPLTLIQTRRMLHTWQSPELHTWISDNFKPLFLNNDGTEHPLDVRIPTSIWTAGIAPEKIKNHWWLMIGDTDFN